MGASNRAVALVHLLIGWWVWAYTRRLPREAQEERVSDTAAFYHEYEADLASGRSASLVIGLLLIGTILRGMPSDVLWRWEAGRGSRYAAWAGAVAVQLWQRKSQRTIDRLLVIASGPFTIMFFVTTTHDLFGGMWTQPIVLLLLMFAIIACAMLVSVGKVIQSLLDFRSLIRETQDKG